MGAAFLDRNSLRNTYYQRDWTEALPPISGNWLEIGRHIAELTLTFAGILHQPAGRFISYTSTGLNSLSSCYQIFYVKTNKKEYVWNLVKNGTELAATFAGIRIGLGVHTVMNLGENLYSLYSSRQLTWIEVGEKMIPVVSNGLYLATLYNFSKKISYAVVGVSLLFQACIRVCKAAQSIRTIKTKNDYIKILNSTAHTALAMIFFRKALTCYEEFKKIEQVIARFRSPSMVKVDLYAAPAQPTVKTSSTEVPVTKQEIVADSKSEEPITLPLEKQKANTVFEDQVKHHRVKREESFKDSDDLAKRWEILDRNLDKITN